MPAPEHASRTAKTTDEAIITQHAYLRARLKSAPETDRTRRARDFFRLSETYAALAQAMVEGGLEDRPLPAPRPPKPRKLTWTQRLRDGLEAGTFQPANAAALLDDLNRAHAGDHAAKRRVVSYLERDGVLEALGDD